MYALGWRSWWELGRRVWLAGGPNDHNVWAVSSQRLADGGDVGSEKVGFWWETPEVSI